ncbi:hypothetical protein Riv7116_1664 [Rivularia sp. PCC 7116]|uniref:hypothetical protein n=1 Tax=Rivularia sp. PCC 7116 TaxID=373994 RepID=UPI00029F1B21|nr:hypothetical protein [Rivularia sp. PCC 7116]AFY54214.1 hypothetical protein Riv7116_1664 [Rivularia sp. PCC 7116]
MIIVLKKTVPITEIERIIQDLKSLKIVSEKIIEKHQVVISLIGDTATMNPQQVQQISPFIEQADVNKVADII